MKYKKINSDIFVIRLEKGEEVMANLFSFCCQNNIKAGYLQGIGALEQADLALYDLKTKKYYNQVIAGPLEIANFFATITSEKIHAHIVVSDKDMQAFGGHLNSGIVAATAEIILRKFSGRLDRYKDKGIGLELMYL